MSETAPNQNIIEALKFGPDGLIPVVTQDISTGAVVMQAYADRSAVERTLKTREATYYSRSRAEQWVKGATSGNTQHVVSVVCDCDKDSLLYLVKQSGPACHTGTQSCFATPLLGDLTFMNLDATLERVYTTISNRIQTLPEQSYVTKLHRAGLDRILKKVCEEAGEVLLAAKNNDPVELASEVADLFFHTLFAMAEVGATPADVAAVLHTREGRSGLREMDTKLD